jgi:hypothetical protein
VRAPGVALMSVLFERLREDYERNGKDVKTLDKVWKRVGSVFGGDRAESVTTDRLERFVADRLRDCAAPATINRDLACLRRMLRLWRQCTPPWVGEIPYFPMLREHNLRMGFFEREEFEGLHAELAPHLKPLFTVAYWLGWRRGEPLGVTLYLMTVDGVPAETPLGSMLASNLFFTGLYVAFAATMIRRGFSRSLPVPTA